MAVHIIKQTKRERGGKKNKKTVYLQIAATYSLLPMPLKYILLSLSVSLCPFQPGLGTAFKTRSLSHRKPVPL